MIHKKASSFAGKKVHVEIDARLYEFICLDWYDRVHNTDKHWYECGKEDPVCLELLFRNQREENPLNDEVLLGFVDGQKRLVHVKMIME